MGGFYQWEERKGGHLGIHPQIKLLKNWSPHGKSLNSILLTISIGSGPTKAMLKLSESG
jgi:hypothetical protein